LSVALAITVLAFLLCLSCFGLAITLTRIGDQLREIARALNRRQ